MHDKKINQRRHPIETLITSGFFSNIILLRVEKIIALTILMAGFMYNQIMRIKLYYMFFLM